MTRKLKVAVVGLGIGQSHIETGLNANPDMFETIALCDRDEKNLGACGDKFNIERRVTDFADILEMDDVDVIDICTPPGTHKDMIIAALKAGKHVICEKPLVGSLADIDDLMEAESRSTAHIMPIMQYRYDNGIQKAKKIIDSGLAGKPFVATCEVHWLRDEAYYATEWRRNWNTAFGGTLMNHAIHLNDLLFYLMGPARSLFARIATRVNPIEVDDCASISLEMKCGALATISATTGSIDQLSRIRLCYQNVTFESAHTPYNPGEEPWKIVPANDEVKEAIDELLAGFTPPPARFAGQMREFHRAICNKTPLPLTLADARHSIDIATACYWSAKTYSAVALPIMADHPFYHGWQNAF